MQSIEKGDEIVLHFELACHENEETIIESTFNREPAVLIMGSGQLPERFESLLQEAVLNEEKIFELSPIQGFGEVHQNNIKKMSPSLFESVDLKIGLIVAFNNANQEEILGIVRSISDQDIIVDFNHPLAGRTLFFKVLMLKITHTNNRAVHNKDSNVLALMD